MTKANAPATSYREHRPRAIPAWLYDNRGRQPPKLVNPATVAGLDISTRPRPAGAVPTALDGDLYVDSDLPNDRTMVAAPVFRQGQRGRGRPARRYPSSPRRFSRRSQALAGERLTALVVAVLVAGLIGFLVASLITSRVKRLAAAAGEIAEGHLDDAASTRAAATRSATSAGRSTRCGSRWRRPSTRSPPSATGCRRSSRRSTRR